MSEEKKAKIKRMYFYADLRPMQIYKITGIYPHVIREIIYGRKA